MIFLFIDICYIKNISNNRFRIFLNILKNKLISIQL